MASYDQAPNLSVLQQLEQFGGTSPQRQMGVAGHPQEKPPSPGSLASIEHGAKGMRQTLERISDQLRNLVDQIAGAPMQGSTVGVNPATPHPVPNGLLAAIVDEHERAARAADQIDGQLARLGVALR